MQIKKILNEKEIRDIEKLIEKNYGCKINLGKYKVFKTGEEKIWIVEKGVDMELCKKLRCYAMGMYFGKLKRNNKIKLSMEGAMMIGKIAKKNVAVIDEGEGMKFIEGENVIASKLIGCEQNNFVIIKMNEDILGVGILRENFIENLVPKARRINF
ncbi:MAG: hypothetical protein FE041_04510 [Thermoplasmata archaeon]|nr:MAG: hypothetical protein FE041_04510 [Thermoplasmata archaeon]